MRNFFSVYLCAVILVACSQAKPEPDPEMKAWMAEKIEENWGTQDSGKWDSAPRKVGQIPGGPVPPPSDPDAMVIKGHRMTESLQAFAAQEGQDGCHRLEGLPIVACFKSGLDTGTATFAGVPADLAFAFVCGNAAVREGCKLYRVNATFDSLDYRRVADAMKLKYGEPATEVTVEKQNRMGASFASELRKWQLGATRVEVEERGGRVDEGRASFLYIPLLRDLEKGRHKELRPDDL